MNKAMLCTLEREREKKNILIINNKIDTEAYDLKVDYQLEDTDPHVQQLISSQVGEKLNIDFLKNDGDWKLIEKKMYISDFDYAYDLSGLNAFINSLIRFKINDKEIDVEIIELLKNDIFSAADFWEDDNIDQNLTAELILKYWDLDPVESYPENEYYKKLLKLADGKIKIIDEKIADFWFDIPQALKNKIKELTGEGEIEFKNYLIYLQTKKNKILNSILFNFIKDTAGESQQSINNLFEKFHYQLVDELTKYSLEMDRNINLNPVIPHNGSERKNLELNNDIEMKEYSLLEIFDHFSIEIDFENLNLLSEDSFESLKKYLKYLASYIDYLNKARKELKCDSCGRMMNYSLDYSQENAVYKIISAYCDNSECEKFEEKFDSDDFCEYILE